MDSPEREVCVCFHVPLGKLAKHYRLNRPRVASQMSDCYGAGTGCGWCIPFLEQVFDQMERGEEPSIRMSADEYRRRRSEYRQSGTRDLTGEGQAEARRDDAGALDGEANGGSDSDAEPGAETGR